MTVFGIINRKFKVSPSAEDRNALKEKRTLEAAGPQATLLRVARY